ncbi:MAG: hypothetical protein AB9856_05735 [Cellulosilyticaceae bacterium]
MKRSVYSLVLMDDVVEAIDALAYAMNTSRSNLINQILAERVALTTPEMRMQAIFEEMTELLGSYQNFKVQNQASDTMLSIRSVLKYKYNPTIRYAISLNRSDHPYSGELKIISRTQSAVLAHYLHTFFGVWTQLERQCDLPGWSIEEGGKWNRKIVFKNVNYPLSCEAAASAIADYIRVIDEGLKIHFTYTDEQAIGICKLTEHYKKSLENHKIII